MDYDVFNGDADGICALHQLRLADPRPEATLVSGVKRDIKLLARLTEEAAAGDRITVLDISMDSNKEPLNTLLAKGCKVFYTDHHFSGDIPENANLEDHIDPSAEVCTSLIIDQLLDGKYRAWAITAAFGDNLHDAARQAAASLGMADSDVEILRELGELINYNGYGATPADLHFTPEALFEAVKPYDDPLEFFHKSEDLARLRAGYQQDMDSARAQAPLKECASGRVYRFPAEAWSKRVAGVFSNERAREKPDMAHALLVDNGDGTLLISVRAPMNRKKGADTLCLAFPTGGGRAGAAGVNALPEGMLDKFISTFEEIFAP